MVLEQNSLIHRKDNFLKIHQNYNGNQLDHSSTDPNLLDDTNNKNEIRTSISDRKMNMNVKNNTSISDNSISSKEVDFSKAIKKGFVEFDLTEEETTTTTTEIIKNSVMIQQENEHNNQNRSNILDSSNEEKTENDENQSNSNGNLIKITNNKKQGEKESEYTDNNDTNSDISENDSLDVVIKKII